MIRWLLLRGVAAAESRFGDSLDYLRHLLRASLGAFFQFARVAWASL